MPKRNGMLQRKCACGQHTAADGECAQCRKKRLQRKSNSDHTPETVPPIVHEVLGEPGRPMDAKTRTFMETRFNHNFSNVRIYTGRKAEKSAQQINALAYTVGENIVFGKDQYSAYTSTGQRLLAHELTHTIQQGATQPHAALTLSRNAVSEREAETIANNIHMAKQQKPKNKYHRGIQKQPSATNTISSQNARQVANDDGITAKEARAALASRIGEERLRQLERGLQNRRGEDEANAVSAQIVNGRQTPSIARMVNPPALQMASPVVIVGGAIVALALCASGFYDYALSHYGHKGDKWLHCYTSCKIATYCGVPTSALIGVAKEVGDFICDQLGHHCAAEWEDIIADAEGIGCALTFWRSCIDCCNEARPS